VRRSAPHFNTILTGRRHVLATYPNGLYRAESSVWGLQVRLFFNEVLLFSCVGGFMLGIMLTAAHLLR
jgi:hypothetical protein